jgi:hypothetical protein
MKNSVTLLHKIIEEGCSRNPNLPAAQVWQEVLGVETRTELVGAFAQFFKLAEDAAQEVLDVHEDPESVEYWKSRIIAGFINYPLKDPWGNFRQRFDAVTLFTLKNHARIVELQHPRKGMTSESVERVRTLFSDAEKFLSDSEIDPRVRELLLSRIEQIEGLLNRYRYVGPSAVLEAAKILAAEISALDETNAAEIRESGAFEKFKDALSVIADATQVASATAPATVATVGLLLERFS